MRLTEQQQDASQDSQDYRQTGATCNTPLAGHFFPFAITHCGLDSVVLLQALSVSDPQDHSVVSTGQLSG